MDAGICGCGCGRTTELAKETRPRRGWVIGKPKPFLPHHGKHRTVSRDGRGKQCVDCSSTKLLSDFYVQKDSPDERQPRCKKCAAKLHSAYRHSLRGRALLSVARRRHKLLKYGLTPEGYDALHDAQNGCCALCEKPETSRFRGTLRALAVDHNHATGRVRGLLCAHCNHAIGKFKDDPALIRIAADYVERHAR